MLCWRLIAVLILPILSQSIAVYTSAADIADVASTYPDEQPNRLRLWLTISAQKRFLEVSWRNAPGHVGDHILITTQEPFSFEKVKMVAGTPLAKFDLSEGGSGDGPSFLPVDGYTTTTTTTTAKSVIDNRNEEASGFGGYTRDEAVGSPPVRRREYWISNNDQNDIVAAIKPNRGVQWFTTGVHFDYALSRNVTVDTGCYGYWASYINSSGDILAATCVRAYPRWMNDLHSVVAGLRLRDLFIPGTHDSGSYRPSFDPLLRETIVTKYALTQDDDIRGQLLHGVRYLDIRVGYYRNTPELFFINHGITRQRPLLEIIDQVKQFVQQTNEIVIFGVKEFPVGFGKNIGVHRLLVHYLKEQFGELIVHPSVSWSSTLRDIWGMRQNVILAYDKTDVVHEHRHVLFGSVEQRWGNVRNWTRLEQHLISVNTFDISRLSSRPVADMAELTPDTWGVILDKYGGLRKMADNVNWRVSKLYADSLGARANIVAVDFIRGTNLVESALEWNKRKVIY